MYVVPISRGRDLARFASEIEQLSLGVPFRRPAWLQAWWQAYGNEHPQGDPQLSLRAAGVFDADDAARLVGFAPFCVARSRQAGCVWRWLGSGEVCSDYQTVSADPQQRERIAAALADWLNEQHPAWDAIQWDGTCAGDPMIESLAARLERAGHAVYRRQDSSCWTIDLPGDWESFLERLSKSHRKQVRRAWRRDFESGRAVMHVAESEAELRFAFDLFRHLHGLRRRDKGERSCFDSPRFARFFETVTQRLFEQDALKLIWLEWEGTPIAVDYNLLGNRSIHAYQGGFDPQQAELQPGWLLTLATIRWSIEQGCRTFDFLRGDEPYKAHWRAEPWPLQDLRIVSRTARHGLRHGIWLAGQKARSWATGDDRRSWQSAEGEYAAGIEF